MSKVEDYVPLLIKIAIAATVALTVSITIIITYNYVEERTEIINNQTKENVTKPVPKPVNDTKPPVVVPPKPEPKPEPKPVPVQEPKKIIMVGDIFGDKGREVGKTILARNPDLVVILGDLGYSNNLNYLKEVYGKLGNKLACVIGNHESELMQAAIQYCGANFYIKHFNTTVILGINTEGDLTSQANFATGLVKNANFMNGVKSIHVTSHKPCANLANSHHGVESDVKVFCDKIRAAVPKNVTVYFDAGHEHNLAEGIDGNFIYSIAGGGGRQLYDCGTVSGIWKYCDEQFGFREYIVKGDGTTTRQFISPTGGVIR